MLPAFCAVVCVPLLLLRFAICSSRLLVKGNRGGSRWPSSPYLGGGTIAGSEPGRFRGR